MLQEIYKSHKNQGNSTRRVNTSVSHYTAYMSTHITNICLVDPLFGIHVYSPFILRVQKPNQLETLADAALQLHNDNKVCICTHVVYARLYVCVCIYVRLGKYSATKEIIG